MSIGFGMRANQRGAALVEFALVLPVLLTLVLGITDFGRAFDYWIDQTHMANTAARMAVVNRYPYCSNVAVYTDCPSPNFQNYIKSLADTTELKAADPNGAIVCVDFPSNTRLVGDPVKVKVGFHFNYLPWFSSTLFSSGGPGLGTVTIVGSATMRLEALPSTFDPANNPSACSSLP